MLFNGDDEMMYFLNLWENRFIEEGIDEVTRDTHDFMNNTLALYHKNNTIIRFYAPHIHRNVSKTHESLYQLFINETKKHIQPSKGYRLLEGWGEKDLLYTDILSHESEFYVAVLSSTKDIPGMRTWLQMNGDDERMKHCLYILAPFDSEKKISILKQLGYFDETVIFTLPLTTHNGQKKTVYRVKNTRPWMTVTRIL